MSTEYSTTTSKLRVQNKWISERVIVEPEKNYWFHSFMILLLLIIYSMDQLETKPAKFISIVMCVIWISPHFVRIYRGLFVNVWRNNIPLKEVKDIDVDHEYNELEEKVTITLNSGRRKIYLFRKAEGQAEGFAAAVSAYRNTSGVITM